MRAALSLFDHAVDFVCAAGASAEAAAPARAAGACAAAAAADAWRACGVGVARRSRLRKLHRRG